MSVPHPDHAERSLHTSDLSESALKRITDALRGLRYGQVTIIVQDERIVQIDRTEKQRLSSETRQP